MKYLLPIFFLILCSCSSEKEEKEKTPAFYFDEQKFKSEWDIWKSQDVKNYSFTLKGELDFTLFPKSIAKSHDGLIEYWPMYPYEVKIVVKNGIMDSFEYIGVNPPDAPEISLIPNPDVRPKYTSISDMYQKMYDRIKDWERDFSRFAEYCLAYFKYEIEYDQEFHYITRYNPDWGIIPGCIFETSEHEVLVSDFIIVND